MELHRARGTVRISEGKKDPRTRKDLFKIEQFDRVVVKGSTEEEWRASFKYHRAFTGDERLKAKKIEADGKVALETIESVCRLGL